MEREDNLTTLSDRLERIENEIGKMSQIVNVLYAEYVVKHVDERQNQGFYDMMHWNELK